MVKNRYALPQINELITRFTTVNIFAKIDLWGVYNLICITEGDEWKTAFHCRFGHYKYCVMPFGLSNAPAVFQVPMKKIFYNILDTYSIVYLDDILIYLETPEKHIQHVHEVLA